VKVKVNLGAVQLIELRCQEKSFALCSNGVRQVEAGEGQKEPIGLMYYQKCE